MEQRPNLNAKISVKDYQEFYWLKEELVTFCRSEKLISTGGKLEISQRIEHYLKTGEKQIAGIKTNQIRHSTFDWKNQKLSLKTEITDNYKNTKNVRMFFEEAIGSHFKFNVKFMNWMKVNTGKTLEDAIEEWKSIKIRLSKNSAPKEIAPQFEYNRYLRDFLADNPTLNRNKGIKLWKLKKLMRGDNSYKKEDLKLIES